MLSAGIDGTGSKSRASFPVKRSQKNQEPENERESPKEGSPGHSYRASVGCIMYEVVNPRPFKCLLGQLDCPGDLGGVAEVQSEDGHLLLVGACRGNQGGLTTKSARLDTRSAGLVGAVKGQVDHVSKKPWNCGSEKYLDNRSELSKQGRPPD
jgi:hypothetical protein